MDKLTINFFRDGKDLIVVFKNCDKSIEEVVSLISSAITSEIPSVEDIPPLKPVEEPEIVKPEIPEIKENIEPVIEPDTIPVEEKLEEEPAQEVNETPAEPLEVLPEDNSENVAEEAPAVDTSKIPTEFRGESFTAEEIETLAKGERVQIKRVSKNGKEYTGFVKMADGKIQFSFH